MDELRTAHKLLVGVGAKPYAERARADLDAAGIPVPARGGSPLDLTERESDVVALVTKGLTNAEVATALYVSANTVDYHLRNRAPGRPEAVCRSVWPIRGHSSQA